MKKFNVGIIGATGMVGQRFISLLENHPWFKICCLSASSNSAGKVYKDVVKNRWNIDISIDKSVEDMVVLDAVKDKEKIACLCDFVFCAVDMPKDDIIKLEEDYAKLECPVISNNSANRGVSDVPMIIPEVNSDHIDVVEYQKRRLGTKKGFIAVKSNCSLQSYVPVLKALSSFGLNSVAVCTYQAISGAGKTFETFPDIVDNIIPFIPGEEEKSENEPLKIFGYLDKDKGIIIPSTKPNITTQCLRVPVSDGHMAAVFVKFDNKPDLQQVKNLINNFENIPESLGLPSSTLKPLYLLDDPYRPQPKLDKNFDCGMGITIGRLREDTQYHIKFVSLSHNTVRGAAGGAIMLAELAVIKGYI